jgi:hypothetical protein
MTLKASPILMILVIFAGVLAGCAPANTPPAEQPAESPTVLPTDTSAPALPSGWETYSNAGQCGYTIGHPADMDGASQGDYNWLLTPTAADPGGPTANFIYISVIPDDFEGTEPGSIYNYDPAETPALLDLPVGESLSLRNDPAFDPWFTYTRLPDEALGGRPAQAYENTQPWEFPPGTSEIRYYLKANGCTYLLGAYLATAGSDQPGAIDEALFDQILATFRLVP